MQIMGLVDGQSSPFDGQFLVEYDPDKRGVDPRGYVMLAHILVGDLRTAKRFPDPGQAMDEWKRVSKRWPVRPDGRPNRPLTAFTVSVLKETSV